MRKLKMVAMGALLAGTALAAPASAAEAAEVRATPPSAPLPTLDVVLAPHAVVGQGGQVGQVDRLDVQLRIGAPGIVAGQALLRMPLTIVSTPTAAYDAAAIHASDERGPLKLTAVDEAATPTATYRRYEVDRATSGNVTVRYATPPRAVDAGTRNGPLFDLRAQPGGVMGAGVYFFALPEQADHAPYRITLKWNMAAMPAGARGVWSGGEGDQNTIGPADVLAFSFYAAGAVQSVPADGKGDFGLYWLAKPPFDVAQLAGGLKKLYASMSAFFNDAGAPYRIFIRANPYPAGGGTALPKSFMFGYGVDGESASNDLQMLLAHEMTHNWPRLDDSEHALTAWYTEGTAEYYSALLALRAGVIDQAKFLGVVNERAAGYYTNVFRNLSNTDAGAKFWTDARAQRVPYGRGFMYLARVDAQIRAASGGKRSLDNLVLEIRARQQRGGKVGNAEWLQMVVAEIGEGARAEFDEMVAGKPIAPLPSAFAPCYRPVRGSERPFDLGFDEMRLGVVSGLRADSAAAAAGVQEGDQIAAITPLRALRSDPAQVMRLGVQRGGQVLELSYLPRGAAVPSWHWERVAGVPEAACKL